MIAFYGGAPADWWSGVPYGLIVSLGDSIPKLQARQQIERIQAHLMGTGSLKHADNYMRQLFRDAEIELHVESAELGTAEGRAALARLGVEVQEE